MDDIESQVRRGPGRPRKEETRAEDRPERPRMDVNSGPLKIHNPNPDYHYAFVLASSEDGNEIFRKVGNGWELVTTDEGLKISDAFVHKTNSVGSIYRVPEIRTPGRYNYLMKIRKEWHDEDVAAEQAKIDEKEKGIFRADKSEGQYGNARYINEN
jgi:hypothetical protein